MEITCSLRRKGLRLGMLAGTVAVLTAGAAATQDSGGILLTLGVDQRFEWADNAGLEIPSEGERFRTNTLLSFGFASETPRDLLTFTASGVLRGEDGATGGLEFGLANPVAELGYLRSGATSSFTTSLFLRETDLEDGLAFSEEEDGTSVLLFENGNALTKGGRLAYSWGEGGPFGGTVRAGLTDTSYTDVTDPDLVDNRTTIVGAGLRFALNEVTEATFDIDNRRYDEDGPVAAEDTTTFRVGLSRALPRGTLRGNIFTTSDQDGSRTGFSFGRGYDLPRGSLSVDLGLTEAVAGGIDLSGALAWQQDLPRGAVSARLSQAVTNDINNDEALVTALSLGLTQELSPLFGLNLGALWSRSEETATGTVTDNASLDAALSYALTEDWNLNAGASHRLRDEDGIGHASSNSVFLSLSRTFEFRP